MRGAAQADGRGRLALALRGGRHGGDEDQLAVGLITPGFQFGDGDFGDVMAVRQDGLEVQAQFAGHFVNAPGREAVGMLGMFRHRRAHS